jgi:predicted site-specific integrase-resolvase
MKAQERPVGTISVAKAAEQLGVTPDTLSNWFEARKVRGWRNMVNRRLFIYESECDRILRESMAGRPVGYTDVPPPRRRKSG